MLEVRDLDVHYRNVQVLFGVSLDIRDQELVIVLGANGAGKSTLLKTISGVNLPSRGTIVLDGSKLTGMPPSEIVKRGISHCPEGRKVFAKMTVLKNLSLGAYTRNDRGGIREDIGRMMELFPILKDRENQLAGSLSGGEQQMLAIARSLMGRPKLLLLDEPSMGLAPILVSRVAQYVEKINQNGVTILLVEQNARMALSIGHRCYILERGRVGLHGIAREFLSRPEVIGAYLGG